MTSETTFCLNDAIALLARTPAAVNSLLRGLPEVWVRSNEGDDTWSPFDIVGHRIILEDGEARPFDKFDRLAQFKESQGKSVEQLLDEFACLRSENLAALEALNLQEREFEKRGTHPALGPVTAGELLSTWAVHDLTHLHQLSRVMAYRYREAVGPWKAYLGVLHCAGHGG